jgi:hypothetical protein
MTPIDPFTYTRVTALLEAARTAGLDPVEHLHRSGLLLTPAKEREIRVSAMSYILGQLQEWSPVHFIRRRFKNPNATTQSDLLLCIVDWLGDHIVAVKEEK